MFASKKKQAQLQTCQTRSPIREWKNRDALETLGYVAVLLKQCRISSTQLKTLGRERRSEENGSYYWQYCLWSCEGSADGERSPRSPATSRNITAIRCSTKNTVTFFNIIKVITRLPSSSWIKGKLLFLYTKNAFYGSNLNHSQMKASWKVKWEGQLPAASPTTDLTKGHQSSCGVYWAWLPTEHIEEAPTQLILWQHLARTGMML